MPGIPANTVTIDGNHLTIEQIERVGRGGALVELDPGCHQRIADSQAVVLRMVEENRAVYGVTTGIGEFASIRIDQAQCEELQKRIIYSHAAGTGDPQPAAVVRGGDAGAAQRAGEGLQRHPPLDRRAVPRGAQPRRGARGVRKRQRRLLGRPLAAVAAGAGDPRRGRGVLQRRAHAGGRRAAPGGAGAAAADVQGRPGADQRHADDDGGISAAPVRHDPPVQAGVHRLRHGAGCAEGRRARLRPGGARRAPLPRRDRHRHRAAPAVRRQRDHGRRQRQGAGRLQHALHAADLRRVGGHLLLRAQADRDGAEQRDRQPAVLRRRRGILRRGQLPRPARGDGDGLHGHRDGGVRQPGRAPYQPPAQPDAVGPAGLS